MKTNYGIIFLIYALILAFTQINISDISAAIPPEERQALIDFYNSTDGDNWKNNGNWLGDEGTECSWYGITCDSQKSTINRIHLENNYLKGYIPSSFVNFLNLKYVDVSHNQLKELKELPHSFGNLLLNTSKFYAFICLNFSYNQLSSLPESFGNLTLTTYGDASGIILNMSNNQLTSLPKSLGNLTLTTFGNDSRISFDLSNNQLTSLPESFGNLTLTTSGNYSDISFNLSNNQLTSLPESLGNLKLTTSGEYSGIILNMFNNQLTSLPESFGNLTLTTSGDYSYIHFYLSHNHLSILPESFNNLNFTTSGQGSDIFLTLSNNQLSSLSESIGNLKLTTSRQSTEIILDLSNNLLSTLPESFVNITFEGSSVGIVLSFNPLNQSPGLLYILEKLILSGTQIELNNNLGSISKNEHEALIDLYNSTNGNNWFESFGWLGEIGTECNWYGVACNIFRTKILGVNLSNNNLEGFLLESTKLLGQLNLSGNELRVNEKDRQALIDLYNSTNGDNWNNKDNWLGEIGTECNWFGVRCNENSTHIIGINLNNNNLSGDIPESIFNIIIDDYSVYYLNFSNNQLASFPESLTMFTFSTNSEGIYIDFSNNQFENLPFSFNISTNNISTVIKSSRVVLDFSNNQLAEFPNSLSISSSSPYISYIFLDFSNNQLIEFPNSLSISSSSAESLIFLDFSNNQLIEFPNSLSISTVLSTIYLNLSNNKIESLLDSYPMFKIESFIDFDSYSSFSNMCYNNNQLNFWERQFCIYIDIDYRFHLYYSDRYYYRYIIEELKKVTINLSNNNITNRFDYLELNYDCDLIYSGNPLQFDSKEREALTEFYYETNGPSWTNNKGWLGEAGTECNWHGVVCDEYGSNIVEINLENNNLTGPIPESIFNLNYLKNLILSNNQLFIQNDAFENFILSPLFKKLDLSNNRLSIIPDSFGNISLNDLNLSNNRLTTLPDSFGNISLNDLNLSNNRLTTLPDSFSSIRLNYLDLSNNRLTTLPDSFGNISLNDLNLSNNRLTTLPDSFSSIRLNYLDLSNNRISKLPDFFGNINVKQLNLSHNLLTTLSDSFCINNFSIVDLSYNQLTSLPDNFGYTTMSSLDLSNNQLTVLPDSFGNFEVSGNNDGRPVLDLSNNQLTSLPESFGNLELYSYGPGKILDLSNNQLASLPESFSNIGLSILQSTSNIDNIISNLSNNQRVFDLSNNQLAALPDSFSNMQISLSCNDCTFRLDLSNNQLYKNPESIYNINIYDLDYYHRDVILDLSNNQLSMFSAPLKNYELRILDPSYNDSPPVIPDSQFDKSIRDALIDLYKNTNGNNWYRKDNWLGEEGSECNWYGIGCNSTGTEILEINLNYNNLVGNIPESFVNIRSIKNLNLSANKLLKLPESFGNIDFFYLGNDSYYEGSVLDLSSNLLSTLPESFGNLKVKEVDLSFNILSNLPDSFGKLIRSAQVVNLRGNQLSSLSDSFGSYFITNVQGLGVILILASNKLSTLPDSFGNLRVANSLDLSNNQLIKLPDSFGNIRTSSFHGFDLNLSNNQLSTLPDSFSDLRFYELNLSNNQLSTLPVYFGNVMTAYEETYKKLDLSNNLLSSLPESFADLNLNSYDGSVKLDLSNNLLTSLPDSFGQLRLESGYTTYGSNLYSVTLDLSNNQLSVLPESFWNLDVSSRNNSATLDLSNNQLTTLPQIMNNNFYCDYLNLSINQLTSLPESFGKLSLVNLYLNNNKLTHLPESFVDITQLINLYLNNNQLTHLPESFGNLTKLEYLNVNNNHLTNLPVSFENLTKLINLFLNNNQLTNIPESFGNFTQLENLYISNNQLTQLPESSGNLIKLNTLYLSSNKLTSLPESIVNIQSLNTINIADNQLTYLPQIPVQIKELNISKNQISSVSKNIEYLEHLESIDLSYNNIESLTIVTNNMVNIDASDNVLKYLTIKQELTNLKSLNLENNLLEEFPAIICKSKLLKELDMSNNLLTIIPEDITKLINLKSIDLSSNQLQVIPYILNELHLLETINLSNNRIANCSSEISGFQNVKSLNLSGNDIKEIPTDIGELTNLSELIISHCNLDSLPQEFGNLTNLRVLDLGNNELDETDLSFSINNLSNLFVLSLASNQIQKLPQFLLNLKKIMVLDLSSNDINQDIPIEIVQLNKMLYLDLSDSQLYTTNPALYDFIIQKSPDWVNSLPPLPESQNDASIRYITSSANQLCYSENAIIPISIIFNSPVTLTNGNLIIKLETGDIDQEITVSPFSNAITATVFYKVQAGDFNNNLNVSSISLSENAYLKNNNSIDVDLRIPDSFNLNDMRNIYVDATIPELDIIYPTDGHCLQQVESIKGTVNDISDSFELKMQFTDGISYYTTDTVYPSSTEIWFNLYTGQLSGNNRNWFVNISDINLITGFKSGLVYTIKTKAVDLCGNKSAKTIEFTYNKGISNITCNISKQHIVLGDSLSITGTITPPDKVTDSGVSIELISPLNQIIYKNTTAQKDGSFSYHIQCNDIHSSGLWKIQTAWEGHDCLFPATSNPVSLSVDKAKTEVVLDVLHDAIKHGESTSISGIYTPYPDCGGDLSGIQILLNFKNGDNSFSKTIFTNDQAGHFQLINFKGLDAFGDWQVQAMVFDTTNAYESSSSEPMIVRVVESAGYAIIIQGKLENEEGLKSHKKTTNFVYEQLKQRGIKDDNDFDDIRFFYNYHPQDDIADKKDIYELPDKTNIKKSLTTWAADKMNQKPANLYVVLVDHGIEDTFFIDPDTISATEIGLWLDTLQDQLVKDAMNQEIVVILGFCHSGSFIKELSGPNRIIIASAAANEFSYKGPLDKDNIREGEFFVSEFFKSVSLGKSVKQSFSYAVQLTERFTESLSLGSINAPPFFDNSAQHPLLDDNGDGTGTNDLTIAGDEGLLSKDLIIGVSSLTGNDPGDVAIIKVAETMFINENDVFPQESPYAILDNEDYVSLWIEIKTPDYTSNDDTTTEQKELELPKLLYLSSNDLIPQDLNILQCLDNNFENPPHSWSWDYIKKESNLDFSAPGTYQIFYFAKDKDSGNVSPFKETIVYKNKQNNHPPEPFNLMTPETGTTLSIQGVLFGCDYRTDPGCYTHLSWEYTQDPDNDMLTYSILFSKNDESFANPCHMIRQERINENAWEIDIPDNWDGSTVYWKVLAIDQFGAVQESNISHFIVNNYGNPLSAKVKSIIYHSITKEILTDVKLEINGNQQRPTGKKGFYFFSLEPSTYNIQISKNGFLPVYQTNVNLEDGLTTLIFNLEPDSNYENEAPVIDNISNIIITEGESFFVSIHITDDKTAPEFLKITPISLNTSIIPENNLFISGTGPIYKLNITPIDDMTGHADICVNVSDGFLFSSQSFSVDIMDVNDPPDISLIDNQEIFEDTQLESLLFQVSDIDSDIESISISGYSSDQSIVQNNDIIITGPGEIRYLSIKPQANAFGTVLITIIASDGINDVEQVFNLNVKEDNDKPIVEDMTINALEGALIDITLIGIDYDKDMLSYMIESPPTNGIIAGDPPNIYYTPKNNFCGDDSFSYYASDGIYHSEIKHVYLRVLPKDCQAIVSEIKVQTDENKDIDIQFDGKDMSGNNNILFYEITSPPVYGNCTVNPTFVRYKPDPNWSGIDRLKYIAKCAGCSDKKSEQAEIIITVHDTIDQAPVISKIDDYATDENTMISGIPVIVTDIDSPIYDIQIYVSSSNQVLIPDHNISLNTLSNAHYLSLTPSKDKAGEAIITVQCVSAEKSDTEEFLITVNPVDDAPYVLNPIKNFIVMEDASYTIIDVSNVFYDNDNDSNEIVTSIQSNSADYLVKATISSNILRLDFQENQTGQATIVLIGESNNKFAETSFSILVDEINDEPVVSDISMYGNKDTSLYILLSYFLQNFQDVDNDRLNKIRIKSLSDNGTLFFNNVHVTNNFEIKTSDFTGTSFIFQPSDNWSGTTYFSWQGFDNHSWSNTAKVIISIESHPVHIATIIKRGYEDMDVEFDKADLAGFSLNYTNSQIMLVSVPENGTVLFDSIKTTNEHSFNGTPLVAGYTWSVQDLIAGELVFRPYENFYGTTKFLWRASKDNIWSDNENVLCEIFPVNDTPVLENNILSGDEDIKMSLSFQFFSSLFKDADNDILNLIQIIQLPENGQLKIGDTVIKNNNQISANDINHLVYVPNKNFFGFDRLKWNAFDGITYADSPAMLSITIHPVDDPPELVKPVSNISMYEDDEKYTIDLSDVCIDVDNDINGIAKKVMYNTHSNLLDADISGNTLTLSLNKNQSGKADILLRFESNELFINHQFSVTVIPVDDPPVVSNPLNDISVDEDCSMNSINLSKVFTDIDNDETIVKSVESGNINLIKASINEDNLLLRCIDNQSGETTIKVNGISGGKTTSTAFNIKVKPVNDPPVLSKIYNQFTDEDIPIKNIVFDISDIDTPLENLTISALSTNQSLVSNNNIIIHTNNQQYSFDIIPEPHKHGSCFIIIKAEDENSCIESQFILTVMSINDRPVAESVHIETNENTEAIISLKGSDPDNTELKYSIINLPEKGILTGNAPHFVYKPFHDSCSNDQFYYQVSDSNMISLSACVSIHIVPMICKPVAIDNHYFTQMNTIKEIKLTGSEISKKELTYSIIENPIHGTLKGILPEIQYIPDSGWFGEDIFSFSVSCGKCEPVISEPGNITIFVSSDNNKAPVILGLYNTLIQEDSDQEISFYVNDPDTSFDSISVSASITPSDLISFNPQQLVCENSNCTLEIKPIKDKYGQANITITTHDGLIESSKSIVLNIEPVNDPPIIGSIKDQQTYEDVLLNNILLPIEDIDTSIQDLKISFESSDTNLLPVSGIQLYQQNQDYYISLNTNENCYGQSIISVIVQDSDMMVRKEFYLYVLSVNDPPDVMNMNIETIENEEVGVILKGSDIENDVLSYTIVHFPENGTLKGNLPDVIYVPDIGFCGKDQFSYQASDWEHTSDSGQVTVNIVPMICNPKAFDQNVSMVMNSTKDIILEGYEKSQQSISYSIVTYPSFGTLSGIPPYLKYKPYNDWFGEDQFAFVTTCSKCMPQLSENAFVNIFVSDKNNIPPAIYVKSKISIPEDTPASISFFVTDSDTFFKDICITATATPVDLIPDDRQKLTCDDSNCFFEVIPADNAFGNALIEIVVSDGFSNVSKSVVLEVKEVNDAPEVNVGSTFDIDEDQSIIDIPITVTDIESQDQAEISILSSNPELIDSNNVIISGTGNSKKLSIKPGLNKWGQAILTICADDGKDRTKKEINLNVKPVNDPPIAYDININKRNQDIISIILKAYDVDMDQLTYKLLSKPSDGVLLGAAPYLFYKSDVEKQIKDSFTFNVSDGVLESNVATVSIFIGETMSGDYNNNNKIDLEDILLVLKIISGIQTDHIYIIDGIIGNNQLGIADAVILMKYYIESQ